MTMASSGLAYVVAIWCIYRLFRRLSLPLLSRLLLTISFALATVALPYVQPGQQSYSLVGRHLGTALVR